MPDVRLILVCETAWRRRFQKNDLKHIEVEMGERSQLGLKRGCFREFGLLFSKWMIVV